MSKAETNGKAPKHISRLDRLIQEAMGAEKNFGRYDDPAREKFPNLWEWMTRTEAGKDHVRQPSKMMLSAGPEGWNASLSDNDLALSVEASSPNLEDIFQAFEVALSGNSASIRYWGKKDPKLRKRKIT